MILKWKQRSKQYKNITNCTQRAVSGPYALQFSTNLIIELI